MTAVPSVTFVDFVENALGVSATELLDLASDRPTVLLSQRESLYAALETTWAPTELSTVPPAEDAELRPIYGRGLLTVQGALSSYYENTPQHAAMAREIKALLLYAHTTVVLNPLSPWFAIEQERVVTEARPDGLQFVRALHAIAELSPLISAGTVVIAEPPEMIWRNDVDVRDALAHVALETSRQSDRPVDQWNSYAEAQDTFLRLLASSTIDPADQGSGLAVAPGDDGSALSDFIRLMASGMAPGQLLPSEDARLASLMELSLPGVDGLTPREMLDVRHDNKFLTFRSDMRAALAEADLSLRNGELESARREVREHMAARAAELSQARARTRLWNATSAGAIGWTVGASLTSLAGWKSALLSLVARSAYDTARARPSHASRALLQHYVTLSRDAAEQTSPNAVASIRAWRRNAL